MGKLAGISQRIRRMKPSWKLLVGVIVLVTIVEVLVGIMQGAYTRDQYRFILVPLPLFSLAVIGLNYGLSTLRNRVSARFILRFLIAIIQTFMTGLVIYIALTRFSFPQLTTYIYLLFASYQVWLAWRKVLGERNRRPKKTDASYV